MYDFNCIPNTGTFWPCSLRRCASPSFLHQIPPLILGLMLWDVALRIPSHTRHAKAIWDWWSRLPWCVSFRQGMYLRGMRSKTPMTCAFTSTSIDSLNRVAYPLLRTIMKYENQASVSRNVAGWISMFRTIAQDNIPKKDEWHAMPLE